ncbi:MAG: XRE family transcriptional regulator [Betaproteobacteria bacterium]|nr:MAG: XRE family transcriptional regulator [Betaproteobacteria bacterium]
MKAQQFEVVRGSGNVYRDLRKDNPDVRQFKAILATEIVKTLDREGLTVRRAQTRTGIAAADFSRIRNADLGRFTVDRLMSIIHRLGSRVEIAVKVRRSPATEQASLT